MIIDLLTGTEKSYFYEYELGTSRVSSRKFATFTDYQKADMYLNFLKKQDYDTAQESNIVASSKAMKSEGIENLVLSTLGY